MITIIARKHLRYDAQGNDIARVYISVSSSSELPAQDGIPKIIIAEASKAWDVSTGDKYGFVVGKGWKKQATVINPMTLKGRVDSIEDLPENAEPGWVYLVGDPEEENLPEYMYTEDGKWDPIGTNSIQIDIDASLSTTSENPVQNKVITAALNSKIGMEDVYGRGIQIPNGTDLHDITTPGSYYCGTAANAATLLNCPVSTGFHLVVTSTVSPWDVPERVRHDLYPTGSTSSAVYSENLGSVTSAYPDGWRPWGVVYNIIDAVPTSGSQYAVTSGGVYDALNALNSTLTPISESAYEALTTKDKPLYFIYD